MFCVLPRAEALRASEAKRVPVWLRQPMNQAAGAFFLTALTPFGRRGGSRFFGSGRPAIIWSGGPTCEDKTSHEMRCPEQGGEGHGSGDPIGPHMNQAAGATP